MSVALHIAFCQKIYSLQHLAPKLKGFRGCLITCIQVCTYVDIIRHIEPCTSSYIHTLIHTRYIKREGCRLWKVYKEKIKNPHWIGSKVNSCIISAMGLSRCIPTVKTQQLIILLQIPGSPSFYWRVHSCCFFKD